jgi:hypothetical protein
LSPLNAFAGLEHEPHQHHDQQQQLKHHPDSNPTIDKSHSQLSETQLKSHKYNHPVPAALPLASHLTHQKRALPDHARVHLFTNTKHIFTPSAHFDLLSILPAGQANKKQSRTKGQEKEGAAATPERKGSESPQPDRARRSKPFKYKAGFSLLTDRIQQIRASRSSPPFPQHQSKHLPSNLTSSNTKQNTKQSPAQTHQPSRTHPTALHSKLHHSLFSHFSLQSRTV